ncbi:MAG: RecX family transcriptional regulator [Sorangiineae bacterium]|nr:RecX family transcriptional regulator [Polyangiaceae bacterium]MEB2321768.1 RecX family transcriptional regulator [Sorangiineae bacterium]
MPRARQPPPLDAALLDKAALAYLERFDSSADNLRRVLMARVRRAARSEELDVAALARHVDGLIERYRASGLLDDGRFAENVARGLRARGGSRRGIALKLRAKGVAEADIAAALSRAERDSAEPELEAAQRLVRRRRLGPLRPEAERAEKRSRDLAALMRAGFSYDVARRALGPSRADEDVS